ncbi:hypothetical protein PspLS_10619 [Pyricularia sp. CBS 133598]|nr:hypothetical protein PspLS_10619 [Pyricularia sp. CBS 133598]
MGIRILTLNDWSKPTIFIELRESWYDCTVLAGAFVCHSLNSFDRQAVAISGHRCIPVDSGTKAGPIGDHNSPSCCVHCQGTVGTRLKGSVCLQRNLSSQRDQRLLFQLHSSTVWTAHVMGRKVKMQPFKAIEGTNIS